ncbi:AfsR/SARP family transcriptional regulator [Phytohabitans houttuyneae]|uniref:SARP family transcriptional regulator n=1 Tax=Phytohabitans houttuyneae TaxID=1076126 RepID=A0A6V8K826_9ACTN|nr:BTAD domain-containing putative transcriptional regulator [Phytohabitans houttuyneae]GFJ76965.1 SARP family transcriptional regulator [Phytohabitans houttuyneae]
MTDGLRVRQGQVRLLGPVELAGQGGPVPLATGARRLLAVLGLRGGEIVGWAQLSEAGIDPVTLDRDAAALAGGLARAGLRGALQTRASGMRVAGRYVDALRYQDELRRARSRRAAGDLSAAVAHYDRALARWRSEVPLDGVTLAGWAATEAKRLRDSRTRAREERWDCLLRRAADAIRASGAPVADRAAVLAGIQATAAAEVAAAELEAGVARHPLRERRWELLLTATLLSHGRAAARSVFQRAVRTFADQLGVEPGERLRALAAAAERGDIAELPEAPRPEPRAPRRVALPVPLTSLLGREALLDDIGARLAAHRLVTLVGPGGAGKTRLAIAAARAEDGPVAWFVDLSVVERPGLVPSTVAETLGLREDPGLDPLDAIAEEIGTHDVLLVLDNCEHLVTGCGEMARELLARCPGLRILATSRAPLRAEDESVVPVPPLPLPATAAGLTLADLATHAATRLFLERAQARSGRPVPEGSADAVAQLCAELDGLPLAIELAAARTPLLSVSEIVARIRTDQRLLHSPDPTTPPRHRTVAAAVESSLEQLTPDVQRFFDRLAVFAGSFDAAAADAVRAGTGADPTALDQVVNASLVEANAGRYRLLMPIRRHALARLHAEVPAARTAHAAHYLRVAESADADLRGHAQEAGLSRLRADAANLRAAMAWLAEARPTAVPYGDLRLATALAMFCRVEGHYREARGWLAAALARHPRAPALLRGAAAADAAMLAMLLCDYPAAAEYAGTARAAYRALGDRRAEARVEMILGSVARERAQYEASAAHLDKAAAIYVECGDELGEARAVQLRGFTAWLAGDFDRAELRLRACRRWFERLGDAEAAASALMNLGAVALYRGDTDRATSLLDAALERYAALGFPEGVGWAHNLRGLVELRTGRADRAEEHLALSLATHRKVGDRWRTASVLEALAEVHRRDDPTRAAELLADAGRIREEIGAPVPACERPDTEATAAALRAALADRSPLPVRALIPPV